MPFPLLAALPFAAKAGLAAAGIGGAVAAGKASKRAIGKGKSKKIVRQIKAKGLTPSQAQLDAAAGGQRAKNPGEPLQADFLHGTPDQKSQMSVYNPQQEELLKNLISRIQEALPNLQLPGQQQNPQQIQQQQQQFQQGFQPYEDLANEGYQQGVASLAERFTSLGGGRLGSPAFTSALEQHNRGFQNDLNAQRQQYGLNQQTNQNSNLSNLLQSGLGRSQENLFHPGQNAGYQDLIKGVLPAAAQFAGSYYGNKFSK